GWARGRMAVCPGIAKDRAAELFVHENAGLLLRYSGSDGSPKGVVDHLLGGSDLRRLVRAQGAGPAEQLRLKRASMIERQNVKRSIKSQGCHAVSLYFR